MARPIPETPDFDLRNKSKKDIEEVKSKESKSIFDISDKICSNTSKNFFLGTFSGWMAGVTVVKVGRIAAFGIGGSVILLHFASELGFINVNWERVKESARQSQAWLDWLLKLIRNNGCYSIGFIGGFFFGVGST